MIQVSVGEAQTHLSRLLARVSAGEEVLITKAGTPVARLVPCGPPGKDRVPGLDRGLVDVPDDFDAPLSSDLMETPKP